MIRESRRRVLSRRARKCSRVRFVLTTTNILQVQKIVGPAVHVLEIVGKPYDLDLLIRAVKEAVRARPTQ